MIKKDLFLSLIPKLAVCWHIKSLGHIWCLLWGTIIAMPSVGQGLPHTFSDGEIASAAEVNENFATIMQTFGVIEDTIFTQLDARVRLVDFGNTAVGQFALPANTTGEFNTAVGYAALFENTEGEYNTAVGYGALESNLGGIRNSAYGANALYENISGNHNIAHGFEALSDNLTGSENVGLGSGALSLNVDGSTNTAVGRLAMSANTSGSDNVALGTYALEGNKVGNENTAVGVQALYRNVASKNTAVGFLAAPSNTSGENNVVMGHKAAYENETGNNNTALGYLAMYSNTLGHENTALGYDALYSNVDGSKNVALGSWALFTSETGGNNTAVGAYADVGSSALSNATAIGFDAKVNASNEVQLGNLSVTAVRTSGTFYGAGFIEPSDATLKEDIAPIGSGLAFINDLNPVSYHLVSNSARDIEMGLLAQEVQAALEKHGLADSGMVIKPAARGHLSLRYRDLFAPIIRAIQELDIQHRKARSEADDRALQLALLLQEKALRQEELLSLIAQQSEQLSRQELRIAELEKQSGQALASR